MRRDDELFEELATAVFKGDLAAAEEALETMKWAGDRRTSEIVMRAKATAQPAPTGLSDPRPMKLPIGIPASESGVGTTLYDVEHGIAVDPERPAA